MDEIKLFWANLFHSEGEINIRKRRKEVINEGGN